MKSPLLWLAGAYVLILASETAFAQADQTPCSPPKTTNAAPVLEARALAGRIDQLLAARWSAQKIQPAAQASDEEFLRRVYLDLAGRIPSLRQVEEFLEDKAPDKRQRQIEDLLKSNLYVKHFIDVWRSLLIPPNNNQQAPIATREFEGWLKERLSQNTPYDVMVQQLLTAASADMARSRRGPGRMMPTGELSPIAFYQANEAKPENLAASTSRLFLGIKLECAQCHDHPHASWTRKQFWEFAAFFSGVQSRGAGGAMAFIQEIADSRTLKIPSMVPGNEKVVSAHYLDGTEPRWQPGTKSRTALASWVTMTSNPYFARTTANRLWAHFFGLGIVEPVDEMGDENPPSHPELLEELSKQLAAHGFDLKYLIRAITNSQAYQRSSVASHPSQNEPRMFARMAVRGLTAEQLFDSLVEATGFGERSPGKASSGPEAVALARTQFLAKFASQEKRTEFHTSILQALALINGQIIADVTSADVLTSKRLAAVILYPGFDTPERINRLYLITLSRRPRAEEAAQMLKYVKSGGPKKNAEAALSDVAWTLLNSAEFMLNH